MDDKDAQNPDSGSEIKKADDKVFDFKSEFEVHDPPSAVTVVEIALRNGNGDDDSNRLTNEANDKINAMSEMEAQTNHESKTIEPISVEGVEPTGEQVDTKSMNEEGIRIESKQPAPERGMRNEVAEESGANDGLKVKFLLKLLMEIPVTMLHWKSPKRVGSLKKVLKMLRNVR